MDKNRTLSWFFLHKMSKLQSVLPDTLTLSIRSRILQLITMIWILINSLLFITDADYKNAANALYIYWIRGCRMWCIFVSKHPIEISELLKTVSTWLTIETFRVYITNNCLHLYIMYMYSPIHEYCIWTSIERVKIHFRVQCHSFWSRILNSFFTEWSF